jgi:hypothetical protein
MARPSRKKGTVMKLGIRRLFTSKTEPTRAQAVAVAGYVKSD